MRALRQEKEAAGAFQKGKTVEEGISQQSPTGTEPVKTALAVGMALGAVVGFIVGAQFESQVLRDFWLFPSLRHNGIDGPFLRVSGVFAGMGALTGAGIACILRAARAR